jgi:CHAT domain-containing protein
VHSKRVCSKSLWLSTVRHKNEVRKRIERRCFLTKELDCVLEKVWKLPNLEDFMKPLLCSQLRCSAAAGPVILLNASSYRCDALIVRRDSAPELVPLSTMSPEEVSRMATDFRQNKSDQDFRLVLERNLPLVWHALVQPVMAALGYVTTGASTDLKPRIWWCPTGPFSFIPIRAAGPYTRSGGPNLTKRVLSSYTPTLRALLRARSQMRMSNECRMLLVAQPTTPGQKPLSSAPSEVKLIYNWGCARRIKDILILNESDAMRDVVVAALQDRTCVHFACHGHQEQRHGLGSALFMQDGPLLLSTIASNRLANADFAFCQLATQQLGGTGFRTRRCTSQQGC